MDTHGKFPEKNIIAVIPARYLSTRLETKLLLPIDGKPLILYTLEQAKRAPSVGRVIVATDDKRIAKAVDDSGNESLLTSPHHRSGSDRIAEVAESFARGSIVVNVQGDEPLIPPGTIEAAVEAICSDDSVDIATTSEKISSIDEVLNPDVVKVVTDSENNALYFSRSPIPFPREEVKANGTLEAALKADPKLLGSFRKHTGLYVYRREFLLKYAAMKPTVLEKRELLEQLRALENGARIRVVEVRESSIGVDTQSDFERVKALIENRESQVADDG